MYIKKAIHSVLNQSFRNFELIIVDDGSTDNGLEIVNQIISGASSENNTEIHPGIQQNRKIVDNQFLAHIIPEIDFKIITQHNQGVSTARNNGVAAAKYDYIAFLDADDWWDPTFLEEVAELIHNYPNAGVYGCNYFYVKNGKCKVEEKGLPPGFKSGYINYFNTYKSSFVVLFNCSFVTVERQAFNNAGGFKPNLKFGEDFDLWASIALNNKVAYLNKPLAYSNQDVEISQRALGDNKLWKPEEHFIFNLDHLAEEERTNKDLKILLDGLRVRSLLKYHLKNHYPEETQRELAKVDFSMQPAYFQRVYRCPRWLILAWIGFKARGSAVKQYFIRRVAAFRIKHKNL